MKQVIFAIGGPAISVNIRYTSTAGQNINAVYTYRLWSGTSNAIITKQHGNNLNDQDDIYWLPTPSASNDGRLIEIFSTLKNNDSNTTTLKIEVEVCQGGQRIDLISTQTNVAANGVDFNQLFIQLKGQ
jgi:Tfp pilus assembly major pilin PilA